MNETIGYYNNNAESFIAGTLNVDISDIRNRFLKYVKPQGKILDAGCGSGRDSLAFMEKGFKVVAFDASEEICRIASEMLGINVECKRFEDLSGDPEYDGIWACASLLHVNGIDLPRVMESLKRLLKPNGIIYVSFKEGDVERVTNGRFFHDMTEDSGRELFQNAGLEIMELFRSQDARKDRTGEYWINIIGKKNI